MYGRACAYNSRFGQNVALYKYFIIIIIIAYKDVFLLAVVSKTAFHFK